MMVNEKVAVVDLKNWRGNEISEELRRRGWRVSYCEDAKKVYHCEDNVINDRLYTCQRIKYLL